MKIDGDAVYVTELGKRHTIDGDGSLPDDTPLKKLNVDGDVSFGKISCDNIKVEGDCFGDSLTAGKIFVDGDFKVDVVNTKSLKVNGDCFCDSIAAENVDVDGDFEAESVKVVESFEISGDVKIDSVESDEIILNTRSGRVGKIQCKDLKIFDNSVDFVGEISIGSIRIKSDSAQKKFSQIRVKNIESKNIEIENCKCEIIKCTNAVIGENCTIEKLFISGKLELNENSRVSEIIRDSII